MTILNEQYQFKDVRYLITSNPNYKRGYDAGETFTGFPARVLLTKGTVLARLDFAVLQGVFNSPWWMRQESMRQLLHDAGPEASDIRREWQHSAALPKPSKGVRTSVIEILLIQPAYAWVGEARGMFNKPGGVEQVYIPNLGLGHGPNRSDYAQLLNTYLLPAVQ